MNTSECRSSGAASVRKVQRRCTSRGLQPAIGTVLCLASSCRCDAVLLPARLRFCTIHAQQKFQANRDVTHELLAPGSLADRTVPLRFAAHGVRRRWRWWRLDNEHDRMAFIPPTIAELRISPSSSKAPTRKTSATTPMALRRKIASPARAFRCRAARSRTTSRTLWATAPKACSPPPSIQRYLPGAAERAGDDRHRGQVVVAPEPHLARDAMIRS